MLTPDTFGKRLAVARHTQGLSQAALAKAVGTHTWKILRLERGSSDRLSVAMLQRLGAVLGVSLDWLIGTPEDAPPTEGRRV